MAKAKAKQKPVRKKRDYTLVRGADGKYYLISTTKKPRVLNPEAVKKVTDLLNTSDDQLSKIIRAAGGAAGSGVHIGMLEVFPE